MAAPASGDAAPEGKFIPFSPIRPFVPRIPRRARRPEASKPREPADARPYALGRGWTKESFVSLDAASVATLATADAARGSHFAGAAARAEAEPGGRARPAAAARTPGPRPGPRLGGLDIAGLAHRPETSPAPSRSAAPAGGRDRELKPPRKALFLDLLSFTEHRDDAPLPRARRPRRAQHPAELGLKGGHMHRR
ncbi:hypothetical protein JL720_14551 [Aureococcus anophagefferens]|nr:hypothetical protein JL720_14551 [Aureococcus anophagefferens]